MIIKNGYNEYYTTPKASLTYKRAEHSVCCLDKYLIVTGSFTVELEQAYRRAERYDIANDKWEDMPPLNQGRALHASCSFNNRQVYIFCGEQMPKGGLICSIERYDIRKNDLGWVLVDLPASKNHLIKPR